MAKRQKKAYLQWPTNTAITCGMWIHKTKTCHTIKSEGYQRGGGFQFFGTALTWPFAMPIAFTNS